MKSNVPMSDTGKPTVLVVDDSPTVIKFLSFSLRNDGFDVVSAVDGVDALERLTRHPQSIDLVITDLNMPNLDGYGLIEAIRQNADFRNLPIIILSFEASDEDEQRGIEAGATSYFVKPFKSSLLRTEVTRLLG